MSFIVATDTSANLPKTFIEKEDVRIIPYIFRYRGEEHTCFNVEDFDIDGFCHQVSAVHSTRQLQQRII